MNTIQAYVASLLVQYIFNCSLTHYHQHFCLNRAAILGQNLVSRSRALMRARLGPLHDPVTWYGISYAGTQVTQWDFQNKATRTNPARLSFVLKVPLCNLRPSIINSVPCDRIVQRAY